MTTQRRRRDARLPEPDELRWLLDNGETIGTLADRYHTKESTVHTAVRRARKEHQR